VAQFPLVQKVLQLHEAIGGPTLGCTGTTGPSEIISQDDDSLVGVVLYNTTFGQHLSHNAEPFLGSKDQFGTTVLVLESEFFGRVRAVGESASETGSDR
jgi:hypothetical protein